MKILSLSLSSALMMSCFAADVVIPVTSVQFQGERNVTKCPDGSLTDLASANTGTAIGGVLGGLAGSKVGKGSGNTAAIAVGALAGAYAGKKVQEKLGTSAPASTSNCPQVVESYSAYRNTATIPVGKTTQKITFETDAPISNLRIVK